METRISAAIVNYKKAGEAGNLIGQLLAPGRREHIGEINVINNFPGDTRALGILAKKYTSPSLPVRIVNNNHNFYFVPALNQAVELSAYRYLLFCEPNFTIEKLDLGVLVADLLGSARYVGVAPRTRDPRGATVVVGADVIGPWAETLRSILMWLNKIMRTTVGAKFLGLDVDYDSGKVEFQSLCNGFILYDIFKLRDIGGVPKQLLMYFSENDIGIRAKRHGYAFLYDPSQTVVHEFNVAAQQRGGAWRRAMGLRDRFYHMKERFGIVSAIFIFLARFINPRYIREYPAVISHLKAIASEYRIIKEVAG